MAAKLKLVIGSGLRFRRSAFAEMAQRLGRTEIAIRAKVRKLQLPHLRKAPPRPAREAHSVAVASGSAAIPRAGRTTLPPLPSLRDC